MSYFEPVRRSEIIKLPSTDYDEYPQLEDDLEDLAPADEENGEAIVEVMRNRPCDR